MKRYQKSYTFRALCLGLSVTMMAPPSLWAQVVKPSSIAQGRPEQLLELKWSDAPLQVVLDHYAELTGRTLIKSPGVPAVLISLKSQDKLTETEFLIAIESVLAMNNIALVPMGDKFLKVVPSAELGTHGEDIKMGEPAPDDVRTSDVLERRVVELKYLDLAEVQPIIEQLKHAYGKIQPLERANSFLIIDTKLNIERIMEIIAFLDKPVDIKVETRIFELQNAEAAQVASRLSELIQESQDQAASRTRTVVPEGTRGVIRAGTTAARAAAAQETATAGQPQSAMDLAQRGIIQGEVKLVADERTNILIIISEPANFAFFDQIVTVLDKAIEPQVAVEVLPLEYADAEEISGILNDFVGAATSESGRSGTQSSRAAAGGATGTDARSTALQDFIASRQAAAARTTARAAGDDSPAGVGQLSENTRILPDMRTNSILLMGRRSDIATLKQVVQDLDVMLSQVMIEAIIIEVSLSDGLDFGIDWLQRSYQVFNEEQLGPGGGFNVREPVFGFGGGQNFQGGTFLDGGQVNRTAALSTGSLTYFATFYDLNVDAILKLAASSSDAKILSTPVVVTTDNTEAKIIVGESRPIVTSTSTTAGGVGRNTFQYQDIGIELTVTPRINPQKFVVMEINQTADNVGGFEIIDGNNVPVITRREMEAQIAVENRSSIVLGGLMGTEARKSRTKVPLLGDIPILGALFRSDSTSDIRTELLVIITPYVMSTPEEALQESQRLKGRSTKTKDAWAATWSDSPLMRADESVENRAPQPLLDRMRGEVSDTDAKQPAPLIAKTIQMPKQAERKRADVEAAMPEPKPPRIEAAPPELVVPPAMVVPEPEEEMMPPLSRIEELAPREDPEIASIRNRIEDPRAAMEEVREAGVMEPEWAPMPIEPVEEVTGAMDVEDMSLYEPVRMGAVTEPVPEPDVAEEMAEKMAEEMAEEPLAGLDVPEVTVGAKPEKRGLLSRLFGSRPTPAPVATLDAELAEEAIPDVSVEVVEEVVEVEPMAEAQPQVEEGVEEILVVEDLPVREEAVVSPMEMRTSVHDSVPLRAETETVPTPKRRGLWSRLFGGKADTSEAPETEAMVEEPEAEPDVVEADLVEAATQEVVRAVEPDQEEVEIARVLPAVPVKSAPRPVKREEGEGEWKPVPGSESVSMPAPVAVPAPAPARVPAPAAPAPVVKATPVVRPAPASAPVRMELPGRTPVPDVAEPVKPTPSPVAEPRPPMVAKPAIEPREVIRPVERAVVPTPEPAPPPVVSATNPADRNQRLAQELRSLMPTQDMATLKSHLEVVEPAAELPAPGLVPRENGVAASPMPSTPRRIPTEIRGPEPMPSAGPVSASSVDDTEAAPPLK